MRFGTPVCDRAPFWCPYVPGHPSSARMCIGTIPVPICDREPFLCPYVPGTLLMPICAPHHSGAQMCPGTIPVATYARAPLWCQYVSGHQSGVQMCMDTIPVPIFVLSPSGEHVPLQPSDAKKGPRTFPVAVSVRAPKGCTYALAPFQCPFISGTLSTYVPGHPSGAHMCPGTLPELVFAQSQLRCPYVTGIHSSAHMCLGTLPVPICARAPFRYAYFPGLHFGTFPVSICAWAPCWCTNVSWHPSVF